MGDSVRSVPIPQRMKHLPLDPRGYPIFFSIQQDDGSHSFLGLPTERVVECATGRLCGICGQPLDYWIFFVGGPLSCKNRVFTEPPDHIECLEYALRVCPFLSNPNYRRVENRPDRPAHINDPDGVPMRNGESWAIYRTRSYRFGVNASGHPLFFAAPAKEISWQKGGTRVGQAKEA